MDKNMKSWMAENRERANRLGVIIEEVDNENESGKVQIGGYIIQLTIPNDGYACALSLEPDFDETLMETLELLNDKLERIRNNPDRLSKVLDNLLQIFEKTNCKKPESKKQVADEIKGPSVGQMAEDAKVECEKALLKAKETSVLQEILPWCSVRLFPEVEKVELLLELKGILPQDNVIRALGFCFDHPLIINLNFSSDQWSKRSFSVDNFGHLEVFVRHNSGKAKETMEVISKAVDGQDEKLVAAAIKSCSNFRQYGPHCLLPQFVKKYFNNCEIGCAGVLYSNGEVAESNNIIVALLLSLGNWMRNLKNFCVICGHQLPPFSRQGYCEGELCLYSFEDLGLGASVLQELQNSELMDLELTLAFAATKCSSYRDVFEPYPAFLLKQEERRSRSGFFSSYKYGTHSEICESPYKQRKHLSNKNIELLRELIKSFPTLSEMQQCSHEMELVLKLGMSWLKKNNNSASLSVEDYGQKLRLPYKILTYILFTNRLSLHPLQQNCRLNVDNCLYQFAVLYDSDKEKAYKQRRKTEGSVFAFHGSPLANWYSIMRNGLRCLSNTEYMSTGNACGNGIYFSCEMGTSISYSRSLLLKPGTVTKEYFVLALCEIMSGEKHSKEAYYVVGPEHENDVVIRYLFVFNCSEHMACGKVKEGHILTGSGQDSDLYKHYKNSRKQYFKEVEKEGMMPEDQLLQLLQERTA